MPSQHDAYAADFIALDLINKEFGESRAEKSMACVLLKNRVTLVAVLPHAKP